MLTYIFYIVLPIALPIVSPIELPIVMLTNLAPQARKQATMLSQILDLVFSERLQVAKPLG